MTGPTTSDRYALVINMSVGPFVAFYHHHDDVIDLLTRFINQPRACTGVPSGTSVWHRTTSKHAWVCITS